MVDVTAKADTAREAVARGSVYMASDTLALVISGRAAKGDVLTTAQLAGIMAAKRTHEFIPLCHPLPLTAIDVSLKPDEARAAVDITATVRTTAKTGVEMEALTAVSVAALTVYDMLKAAQRDIRISDIRLVRKTGGKSGKIELESSETASRDELLLQTGDRITDCRRKVMEYCRGRFRSFDEIPVARDDKLREDEVRVANQLGALMGDAVIQQFMVKSDCVGAALSKLPTDGAIWDDWDEGRQSALADLFACVLGPDIGLARATKVLHKKRPDLIPILDVNVRIYADRAATQRRTGLPGWDEEARRGVAVAGILRDDVTRNLSVLRKLGQKFGLSPLRVFDILIWTWSR